MTWVIKQSTSESFSTTALMGFMNKTVLNRRDLVDRQAGLPQRTVSAIVKNRWNLFRNGHFQRLHDDMAALDALTNAEGCEFEERDAIADTLSPDDDHRSELLRWERKHIQGFQCPEAGQARPAHSGEPCQTDRKTPH